MDGWQTVPYNNIILIIIIILVIAGIIILIVVIATTWNSDNSDNGGNNGGGRCRNSRKNLGVLDAIKKHDNSDSGVSIDSDDELEIEPERKINNPAKVVDISVTSGDSVNVSLDNSEVKVEIKDDNSSKVISNDTKTSETTESSISSDKSSDKSSDDEAAKKGDKSSSGLSSDFSSQTDKSSSGTEDNCNKDDLLSKLRKEYDKAQTTKKKKKNKPIRMGPL